MSELVRARLVERAERTWRCEYPGVPALVLGAVDAETCIDLYCERQGLRRRECDEVMAKFHCYQVELPAKGG
jgi:hypothetical protein